MIWKGKDCSLSLMIMYTCKKDFKNVCITDRHLVKGAYPDALLEKLQEAIRQGVSMIILREKDLPEKEYEKLAYEVIKLCRVQKAICMLHTFKDAAMRLDHPYIHLTMKDFMEMSDHDKSFFKMIGVSTHSVSEARTAERLGASYITASHIFETDCKKGLRPRGLDYLKSAAESVDIDVYALGGINPENAYLCIEAGADGVCMMSYFMM